MFVMPPPPTFYVSGRIPSYLPMRRLVLPTGLELVVNGNANADSVRGGYPSIRVPLQSTATIASNELSELRFTNNNSSSANFGQYFDSSGVWHWAWAGTNMCKHLEMPLVSCSCDPAPDQSSQRRFTH